MIIWFLARVIKSIFLRTWLILFGWGLFAAGAIAGDCSSQRPIVTLGYSIKPTQYVRDVSSKDLTETHRNIAESSNVLGHAGGTIGTRFTVEFETISLHARSYCLRIRKVKAQFYAEPVIHIASNFKRGSCEYNKILRHEREHVKILRKAHAAYISRYRMHLRKVVRGIPDFPSMDIVEMEHYRKDVVKQIHRELSEYMERITQYVSTRQKEIDTPEEYRRLHKKCKRWDEKLKDN